MNGDVRGKVPLQTNVLDRMPSWGFIYLFITFSCGVKNKTPNNHLLSLQEYNVSLSVNFQSHNVRWDEMSHKTFLGQLFPFATDAYLKCKNLTQKPQHYSNMCHYVTSYIVVFRAESASFKGSTHIYFSYFIIN